MRTASIAALLFLVSSFAYAGPVVTGRMMPVGAEPGRGLYQCDDGTSEYFWNADFAGEGMANQFNAGGVARIDTIFYTVMHSTGTPQPVQSAYVCVWADAGGVPGAPLYQGLYDFPVPEQGFYWWVALDLAAANIVVNGNFWVGYLDDGTMTYQPYLDNPTACNTYMYTPADGWEDMEGYAGIPLGLYFRCWASEGVPVELTSFDATAGDGEIVLRWATASETNTFGYRLLRSLQENGSFAAVGDLIRGAGTTNTPQTYSFTDRDVQVGVRYYYELVDVDASGAETVHGPVNARLTPPDARTWGAIKAEFK
ncbi:MAG: hypothetical protein MUE60_01710 [Candidatus Eisenbacteria bacterium]|jgi:hypothetical protein|nr:hypothetical protein [Candidatus Eisenbacteria bacterium]